MNAQQTSVIYTGRVGGYIISVVHIDIGGDPSSPSLSLIQFGINEFAPFLLNDYSHLHKTVFCCLQQVVG